MSFESAQDHTNISTILESAISGNFALRELHITETRKPATVNRRPVSNEQRSTTPLIDWKA